MRVFKIEAGNPILGTGMRLTPSESRKRILSSDCGSSQSRIDKLGEQSLRKPFSGDRGVKRFPNMDTRTLLAHNEKGTPNELRPSIRMKSVIDRFFSSRKPREFTIYRS